MGPRRLSSSQHGKLLLAIEALYACRVLEEFPSVVTQVILGTIDCDSASYNEVYAARERTVAMLTPVYFDVAAMMPIFRQYLHQHPVINYVRETGDGAAYQIDDFLTRRQFHATELYREFFKKIAVEHQLSFSVMPPREELVMGIAISRGSRRYTEAEREMANQLRPHVARAYLNLVELRHLQGQLDRLTLAVDSLDEGLILLSHQGIVLQVSAPAREMLARHFGWQGGARLPGALERWARESLHAQQQLNFCWDLPQPGGGRLIARLSDHSAFHYSTILVAWERLGVEPALLETRLHLTRREAEVLSWLAAGKSNAEIAAILGTSLLTVKTQVRNILEKLGVENRTTAAALALAQK